MNTVILGAGLAGLSAAYHGDRSWPILEATGRPGGECATDRVEGFAFDRAGHLLHLQTSEARQLAESVLPAGFQAVARDARVRISGRDLRYPFQSNLFGLDPGLKARALMDYLSAVTRPGKPPGNFLEWARQSFGETMVRLFFEPYNRKLWTVDPAELTLAWMRGYVPKPDLARVLNGAFAEIPAGGGYNASFLYPRRGGISGLVQALADRVQPIRLNTAVRRVDVRRRRVLTSQGTVAWERIISTLPLPSLVAMLADAPPRVLAAGKRLRSNSVLVVNLGVKRAGLHPAHWLYFPEKEFIFYRVGFPSNYGQVAPPGCSALYAEVALPQGQGWSRRGQIAARVRRDLLAAGILRPDDQVLVEHCQYIRHAYVIFDRDYAAARETIMAYLHKAGIESVGRWGGWEYSAMEDALLAGKAAAERILARKSPKKE